MREVLLAVEDPEKKVNGLYWVLEENDDNKGIFYEPKPTHVSVPAESTNTNQGTAMRKVLATMRHIRCRGRSVHTFSRNLYELFVVNSKFSSQKQINLADLLFPSGDDINSDIKNEYKPILDSDTTRIFICPWNGGFLLSLYCADSLHTEIRRGPLLYLPTEDLENITKEQQENITIISGSATGPMAIERNALAFISGNKLERRCWETDVERRGSWQPLAPLIMSGELLSVSCLEDIVVCSDNREGYIIAKKDRDSGEKYQKVKRSPGAMEVAYLRDNFTDGRIGPFLPSEATSVLLAKWDGKKYLICGLDFGIISIYELEERGEEVIPHFKSYIPFISSEAVFAEAKKDNHVRNLRNHKGFISATLRNLYFEVRFDHLLEYSLGYNGLKQFEEDLKTGIGDKTKKIKQSYLKYLHALKQHYTLERIAIVPHRILDYDFLGDAT